MTDLERQYRLHVENRLGELRAKHGTDLEDVPMPAWLESMEGAQRELRDLGAAGDPFGAKRPHMPALPLVRVPLKAQRPAVVSAPVPERVDFGDLNV